VNIFEGEGCGGALEKGMYAVGKGKARRDLPCQLWRLAIFSYSGITDDRIRTRGACRLHCIPLAFQISKKTPK